MPVLGNGSAVQEWVVREVGGSRKCSSHSVGEQRPCSAAIFSSFLSHSVTKSPPTTLLSPVASTPCFSSGSGNGRSNGRSTCGHLPYTASIVNTRSSYAISAAVDGCIVRFGVESLGGNKASPVSP
jgi:hypothetical protein